MSNSSDEYESASEGDGDHYADQSGGSSDGGQDDDDDDDVNMPEPEVAQKKKRKFVPCTHVRQSEFSTLWQVYCTPRSLSAYARGPAQLMPSSSPRGAAIFYVIKFARIIERVHWDTAERLTAYDRHVRRVLLRRKKEPKEPKKPKRVRSKYEVSTNVDMQARVRTAIVSFDVQPKDVACLVAAAWSTSVPRFV